MTSNIPQPPGWPVVGNAFDFDPIDPIGGMMRLADKYGEIFKATVFGNDFYTVSSVALCEELCDESRFCKKVDDALEQLRNGVGDGLISAHSHEHNWAVAHRTLMPSFNPLAIKDMYEEMHDLASQLISKWARGGPDTVINLTDDTTRLTLDTIAFCAMGQRYNSFYREEMHPFIGAVNRFLIESGNRTQRTKIEALLNPGYERQYRQDIAYMKQVAQECIDRRKAGTPKKDLLDTLLNGRDPKTGEKLTDESVINNMITFLVAGHETTSGLMSFAIYHLLKNPETLQKAQQEVDSVVGTGPVAYQHISKLHYIEAVLRETLRLTPSVPGITVGPVPGTKDPVVIGGKYVLPPDASISMFFAKSFRDPAVYGEDANEFKPERMLEENFRKLPTAAWKPFGNGSRACIGRPFSWQEALLGLCLILQNFNLRLADPSYELKVVLTITQKPVDLYIKASLRDGIDPIKLQKKLHGADAAPSTKTEIPITNKDTAENSTSALPMTILFGSDSGTCEGLAQSLASTAKARGFGGAKVLALDAAVDNFPRDQPVAIVTCTYEGQPPSNAKIFMEWLKTVNPSKLSGAKIAVFGCGHRDWASSYQRIPKAIEDQLVAKGATSLVKRGETDVSRGSVFDDFDTWVEELWHSISPDSVHSEPTDAFGLDISTTSRASHLHYNVKDAKVLSNELLTHPDASEKRHLNLHLPTGMQYDAGDYLAVLPVNNEKAISRVLRRFSLPWDSVMTLTSGSHATIPANRELSIALVLAAYVELSLPATKKSKEIIAKYANRTVEDDTGSVIDILERNADIKLPFGKFLEMLPPLRLRQYSISSSPLSHPSTTSITFSVIASDRHLGATTNYLKHLEVGSTVQVAVKKSTASFHLPLDDTVPIIMVCAGTGLAPFRGFVQERALKAESGRPVGKAVLFVGCRNPSQDRIFADELDKWEAAGVVKVFYAFSRASDQSDGCRYVQDRLWKERNLVTELFDAGARTYVCGSSQMGREVSEVAAKIVVEKHEQDGEHITLDQAKEWWETLRGERFAIDVFD